MRDLLKQMKYLNMELKSLIKSIRSFWNFISWFAFSTLDFAHNGVNQINIFDVVYSFYYLNVFFYLRASLQVCVKVNYIQSLIVGFNFLSDLKYNFTQVNKKTHQENFWSIFFFYYMTLNNQAAKNIYHSFRINILLYYP